MVKILKCFFFLKTTFKSNLPQSIFPLFTAPKTGSMVGDKEKLEQGNFHTYFLTFSSDKFPSFTEEGGRDHVKSSGDFFDIKNRPVTEVGLMIKVHIIAFSEKKKKTITICTSYTLNKVYPIQDTH